MSTPEETKQEIDLQKLKEERVAKAIPQILKLLGNIDNLIPPKMDKAGEKLFNEAASKFFDEMLVIFSNEGIVREDFSTIFASIKAMLDVIEMMLKNQVGKLMNEILTTVINIKDPMGGNDIAYAKHTDIAAAVLKLRKEYGGDENHSSYFNKVEEGELIPSPVDMSE